MLLACTFLRSVMYVSVCLYTCNFFFLLFMVFLLLFFYLWSSPLYSTTAMHILLPVVICVHASTVCVVCTPVVFATVISLFLSCAHSCVEDKAVRSSLADVPVSCLFFVHGF